MAPEGLAAEARDIAAKVPADRRLPFGHLVAAAIDAAAEIRIVPLRDPVTRARILVARVEGGAEVPSSHEYGCWRLDGNVIVAIDPEDVAGLLASE